jgi:cytochrome c2
VCHDIDYYQGTASTGGPVLQDVYMSAAGTRRFSGRGTHLPPLIAARDDGILWNDENLMQYLRDPKAFLDNVTGRAFDPAYYMQFSIGPEGARRDVVAYLKAIKGRPECD